MKMKRLKYLFIIFLALPSYAYSLDLGGITINGKFDVNYELRGFHTYPTLGSASLVNYHHFIFLSRKRQDERFFFNAEVIEQYFYEIGVRITDDLSVKAGKIFVPFGSDPLFHHEYGGLTGFDQKLVPVVWTEHGIDLTCSHRIGSVFLSNEVYLVNGFGGDKDKLLLINSSASPSKFALGDRLKFGFGKYSLYSSFYWDQYDGGSNLLLWGVDAGASFGFLDYPLLRNIAVKAGFVRADVKGSNIIGDYFHFGDYLRLDMKLPVNLFFRYMTGTKTIQNYRGFVWDKDNATKDDTTSHNISLSYRNYGFTTGLQYIINLEAKDEQKDDIFRLFLAYEF